MRIESESIATLYKLCERLDCQSLKFEFAGDTEQKITITYNNGEKTSFDRTPSGIYEKINELQRLVQVAPPTWGEVKDLLHEILDDYKVTKRLIDTAPVEAMAKRIRKWYPQ